MPSTIGDILNESAAGPMVARAVQFATPVIRLATGPAFASVPTITTSEQTMTVTGVEVGDFVWVNKPTHQTGLGIAGSRVSALNTVAITFVNPTAAGITPTASEVYRVLHARALA